MPPIHLVLVVVLQNLVRPVLLEDYWGVLLLLRHLAEFGWMVGLQNLFLPTLQNRVLMGT